MAKTVYVDENGYHVFADPGISGGRHFLTVRQDPLKKKGRNRVKSRALPERPTIEEAQADLDAYAERRGWKKLEDTDEPKRSSAAVAFRGGKRDSEQQLDSNVGLFLE